MNVAGWIQRNGRLLAVVLLGTVLVVEGTEANYPSLPDWTGLAVTAGIAVALAGWIAAGKIYAMLPEERGIFLVAFDADHDQGGKVWELSEDQFADMEVHNGRLLEWPGSIQRVYEVREYRPDDNVAVANWRETVSGSELAGHSTAAQAMDQIAELRESFETEAERAKFLRRRLPSIIRKLDRQRAKDQARSLEPHIAPSTESTGSITDVLDESLPNELLPDHMQGDEAAQRATDDDGDGWESFDLLDDNEPLEPVGGSNNNAVADD